MSNLQLLVHEIKCGTTKESANIYRQGAWIVLKGCINVNDPCYGLKLVENIDSNNNVLDLVLKVYRRKTICIKCLARISYEIKINSMHYKKLFNGNNVRVKLTSLFKGVNKVLFDDVVEF